MTEQNFSADDEIDLAELFSGLVSSWRFIAASTVVCLSLSATYATYVARPTFEAKSVFAFETGGSGGGIGNLGGAAALLGLNMGSQAGDKLVFDRVAGRDFVIELAKEADLYSDPYFNPRIGGVGRLALLKSYFGIEPQSEWTDEEVDQSIVGRFEKSVKISATKNSSIEAVVTHRDPEAAAYIANAVVQKILDDTLDDQISKSTREVTYLGEQLSKVQAEMDAAVMRLQDFSISRNALSLEDLVRRSAQLVKLRETRDATRKMLEAVKALASAGEDEASKASVLKDYPELQSSEFRIQAQISGSNASLLQLSGERLGEVRLLLAARVAEIDAAIQGAEVNARISADEASELLTLQREVKVREATYGALVETYKSRSLVSGFTEATGTVLQVAVPPLNPSAPKSTLILALGAVLGLFLGSAIALIRGSFSGRLFTARAIAELVQPKRTYRFCKVSHPSEAASSLAGNGKYTLLWPVSASANALVRSAAKQLQDAWSDAGLRAGLVNLPAGEGGIDIGETSAHVLRGTLASTIEEKTSELDRVVIACEFGAVPHSVLTMARSLPLSVIVLAVPRDALRTSLEEVRRIVPVEVLALGDSR